MSLAFDPSLRCGSMDGKFGPWYGRFCWSVTLVLKYLNRYWMYCHEICTDYHNPQRMNPIDVMFPWPIRYKCEPILRFMS